MSVALPPVCVSKRVLRPARRLSHAVGKRGLKTHRLGAGCKPFFQLSDSYDGQRSSLLSLRRWFVPGDHMSVQLSMQTHE